jgi:hypothetical protein
MKTQSFIALAVFLMFPAAVSAEGLDALIEMGRGQAEIQKAYAEEAKAYERVRAAVDKGDIAKGRPKKDIREEYGNPVIDYTDFATKRETWVYKPAKSDFMGNGVRLYIYFDSNDLIDEIAVTGRTEEQK